MNNEELQRTNDWFQARCGKVTASRLYDVIGRTQSGTYFSSRQAYKMELVLERLTGSVKDSIKTKAMKRGVEYEPLAKDHYMMLTGNDIQEVGLIDHPEIKNFGASPDGLIIGFDGKPLQKGLEIKCPSESTHIQSHIDALTEEIIDPRYIAQMQAGMMCTGFDHWVFMSYDDRFPAHLQSFIVEIGITEEIKEKIEFEVNKFNVEVDQIVEKLMNIKEVA